MEKGLDELIEWLFAKIGFSGLEGFTALDLVKAVKTFYRGGDGTSKDAETPAPSDPDIQEVDTTDIAHASIVWKWLVARNDVIVTPARASHMSLEEVLALSEEEAVTSTVEATGSKRDSGSSIARDATKHKSTARSNNVTARLTLSEERQWRAIAGHAPDLKRIPQFEWKALVAIASVKEKGILQGDLVRLTGQDKRSLPTRTDALFRKGYIVKQPYMLRGCRTSKLWLAQFAGKASEETVREGLPLDKLDLSKETLTRSWDPVPFSHFYNGERLDYLAIAQTFIAVVKAYGAMRYCDLRMKMDVENRQTQMRGLAKSTRWFSRIGVIRFEPMQSRSSNKLFKDCVKYIREPTDAEWKRFRTTPKARMKVPSSRIRKAKPIAAQDKPTEATPIRSRRAGAKPTPEPTLLQGLPSPSLIKLSAWTPYKPMINTVFDIIRRGGINGSSNAEIGTFNLGFAYRKWIYSLTTLMALPRSPPVHLQAFVVVSQLNRVGKTNTYKFVANGLPTGSSQYQTKAIANDQAVVDNEHEDEGSSEHRNSGALVKYAFPQPPPSMFLKSSSKLLGPIQGSSKAGVVGNKRKRVVNKESSVGIDLLADRIRKRARQNGPTSAEPEDHCEPPAFAAVDEGVATDQCKVARPPGVSYGMPNSLAPSKTIGRPPRSIVMIFNSPALRDPQFFSRERTRLPPKTFDFDAQAEMAAEKDSTPVMVASDHMPAGSIGEDQEHTQTLAGWKVANQPQTPVQTPAKRGRRGGRKQSAGSSKSYKCDNCGKTWKNPNGLEYHQKKSQSACNPSYVPPPPKPAIIPTLKQNRKSGAKVVPDANMEVQASRKTVPNTRRPSDPSKVLPSKRPQLAISQVPFPTRGTTSQSSTIVSDSVQLHNVAELPALSKDRMPSNVDRTPGRATEKPPKVLPSSSRRRESTNQGTAAALNQGSHNSRPKVKVIQGTSAPNMIHESNTSTMVTTTDVRSSINIDHTASSSLLPANPNSPKGLIDIMAPSLLDSRSELKDTTSEAKSGIYTTSQNLSLHGSIRRSLPTSARHKTSMELSARTLGTIRRDRTAELIQGLLDQNGHVLPGDRALHLIVTSRWAQQSDGIGPPDYKICQSIIKQMEENHIVKQEIFGFLDRYGTVSHTSVISRVSLDPVDAGSVAGRVTEVKNKVMELHPNPYIPTGFSLPPDGSDLINAAANRRDTIPCEGDITHLTNEFVGKQLATLGYEMPDGRPFETKPTGLPHVNGVVRPGKRRRRESAEIFEPHSPVRRRRRVRSKALQEAGDTADVDDDIVLEELKGPERQQSLSSLQDPRTGAWSWQPQQFKTVADIDQVIAPMDTGRQATTTPAKRRTRQKRAAVTRRVPKRRAHVDADLTWGSEVGGPDVDKAMEMSSSTYFLEPTTSAVFALKEATDNVVSEEEEEEDDDDIDFDTPETSSHFHATGDVNEARAVEDGSIFTPVHTIEAIEDGVWPNQFPRAFFMNRPGGSFTVVGKFPDSSWFLKENLPHNAQEMLDGVQWKPRLSRRLNSELVRDVMKIQAWELSPEGVYLQSRGTISPEYIFISLSVEADQASMKPNVAEWPDDLQYTISNFPDDLKDAPTEDDEPGLVRMASVRVNIVDEMPGEEIRQVKHRRRYRKRTKTQRHIKRSRGDWKTRSLYDVPKRDAGRWNKSRAVGDNLGRSGETELLVAIVVIRKLVGGVEKLIDWGLLIKLYPAWSLSGIKRYWNRLAKERANFIDALSRKFEPAFLEAYEKGELALINYDDLANYDWKTLFTWAMKLESHDGIELPATRSELDNEFSLTDPKNTEEDWRELWYGTISSIFLRMDGAASQQVTVPATPPVGSPLVGNADVQLAKSWIRALCNNANKSTVGEHVRDALLQLGKRDKASLNTLLEHCVTKLVETRVITRVSGKGFGQVFKLHNILERRAEKFAHLDKFTQAVAFKAELDESFRSGREVVLPYNASDGAIMAMINLQAYGRVNLEGVGFPHVPYGFEPGNYEGRKFPKTYYQFDVKFLPGEQYMYDEDLPVVAEAKNLAIPKRGALGEIPIWYDFFDNLDQNRWIHYLCMMAFALALKGPLTAESAVILLSPTIEAFEAQLIMDWFDRLGLLERMVGNGACTIGEWWWLVVGKLVDVKGKGAVKA
ncbi:hypothetical protein BJ170DRAFT_687619 [Xylariales sp. AK1849]|nr:hypothetical protein BJ170DRAFT_687619 [Xylariales sp. AK1849]